MIDVSVVVATCGLDVWREMGDLAALSAANTGAVVVRVHLPDATVAQARNKGLSLVKTEYVTFLDADDELDPRYFLGFAPQADVTATQIKYPQHSMAMMPTVWQHENYAWKHHRGYCVGDCLVDGNWVHIGAICRTEAVRAVGGFREYPVYEDWALFLAMQQNGATFAHAFGSAIYYAAVRDHGMHRNGSMPLEQRNLVHERIFNDIVLGS
jgi:glycosyltransferase involved in cell wall biosynthesis